MNLKRVGLVPVTDYIFEKNEAVMVSICIGTYNQKDYIRQCIESILSQLVNFRVEILINDDASNDGTQDILFEYQKRFPNIIKVFINEVNQFQISKLYSDVYRIHASRINGKYVSLCDGDDYFCNNLAIFYKVKALESHRKCYACYSRVIKIREGDGQVIQMMPEKHLNTGIVSSKNIIKRFTKSYCFQTSSYFFRAQQYIAFCSNYPLFAKQVKVFDEPVVMYFGSLGNAFYLNKKLSVYRKFSKNSWSNNKINLRLDQKISDLQNRINYFNEFNKYTNYKYAGSCKYGILHSKLNIYIANNDFNGILKNKELVKFMRKNYICDYIRLKLRLKSH